jgi:hypothetical protein
MENRVTFKVCMKTTSLIFLIFVVFSSCNNDPFNSRGCGDFNTYYDARAFGYFETGTFWVYQNQVTLEKDTFTVFNSQLFFEDGKEIGFYTQMERTFENAQFSFNEFEAQIGSPFGNKCDYRRIWMTRVDFDSQGQVGSIQDSDFYLPMHTGLTFNGFCSDLGSVDNIVENIEDINVLSYNNLPSFTIAGPSFSLNSCNGEIYRYQFVQGIGLVSWENLDAMDGKWELIEFHKE